MTLSQLRRRIAVLEEGAERHFPKPKPPSEEMLRRLAEFLGRLLPTMAQEHWPLVEAYLKDRTGTKGALSSGLFHAFNRLWWRVRKGSERAVALPPVVVNV